MIEGPGKKMAYKEVALHRGADVLGHRADGWMLMAKRASERRRCVDIGTTPLMLAVTTEAAQAVG